MERRYSAYLIVLVSLPLLLLALADDADAQNGACPPNSLLVGTPSEWYPSDTAYCGWNLSRSVIWLDIADGYPCDQLAGQFADVAWASPWGYEPLVIVPPSNLFFSQIVRIRFYLMEREMVLPFPYFPPGDVMSEYRIRIEYYGADGNLYTYAVRPLTDFQTVSTYWEDALLINHYYQVSLVDQTLITNGAYGGFFVIKVEPIAAGQLQNGSGSLLLLSSVRIGAAEDALPEMCTIPNANAPQPTPDPLPTVVATWTPFATPSPITTPGATSPAATPSPAWTMTPIVYPTLMSEATATPWPIPQLQSITFPTLDIPTVPTLQTPDAVEVTVESNVNAIEAQATLSWDMFEGAVDIATRWADPLDWSESRMAITETVGGGGYVLITGTEGISSTLDSFNTTINTIAYPIRFMKTIREYMPNMWWLVSIMFAGLIVYVAIIVLKVAIAIISEVIEIIRRIWEAIPLN